jgi:4-diphosphocytidyl-2C-methyl-D-erythritol kinase
MLFFAPAKINLALQILRKRQDGYHEVDMILQSVSLKDCLEIEKIPVGIELTCNVKDLPTDSRNLVWQAADLLKKKYSVSDGARIHLEKVIPAEAGLAGGSADCAATLRGLNRVWGLNLSTSKLQELGAELGSDVPFCILGGTARGQGRGERLTMLSDVPHFHVLLVKPAVGVSTRQAYGGFREDGICRTFGVPEMVKAIERRDREAIQGKLNNDFENWILKEKPIIAEIMQALREVGAKGVGMSGSGPTVFALGDSKEEIERWQAAVKHLGATWLCETLRKEEGDNDD